MAHNEGSEQQEHGAIHLPDPSIWPLVVGFALFCISGAVIWWAADSNSSYTGPALGAAFALVFISVIGWIYEDGIMRQKADHHEKAERGELRRTQIITFAIEQGALDNFIGENGLLQSLQHMEEELGNTPGFEDFRINISQTETGPSQVVLETTWSTEDALEAYEGTRQTIVDLINQYEDTIATGSLQTFDMDVVRDTKDVSAKFPKGVVFTILGAFIVGGFALGAGLTTFQSSSHGTSDGGGVSFEVGPFQGTVSSVGSLFLHEEISLPPDSEVTLIFENQDATPHNVAFFRSEDISASNLLGGCTAGCDSGEVEGGLRTELLSGPVQREFTFTTPQEEGEYIFLCEIHPDTMRGILTIAADAPIPGMSTPEEGTTEEGTTEEGT